MNRQAITFFSLFSLILVLSVYYMMIPPTENIVSNDTETKESLQDILNDKRENEQRNQNEILASSVSTTDQLNDALNQMDETTKNISIETKVKEELTKIGYTDVFCEINEKTIKITIKKTNEKPNDVVEIMNCIDLVCNEKYMPEIKFISE